MAINNTEKTYAFMEFPLSMSRQDAFALDKTSVWASLAEAQAYAQSDPRAYVGQTISVVENGVSTAYQIKNAAGELEKLGSTGAAADMDVATEEEIAEMLTEYIV